MFPKTKNPSPFLAMGSKYADSESRRLSQQPPCARTHLGATTTAHHRAAVIPKHGSQSLRNQCRIVQSVKQFDRSKVLDERRARMIQSFFDREDFHRCAE
jgi:hypothetical protein